MLASGALEYSKTKKIDFFATRKGICINKYYYTKINAMQKSIQNAMRNANGANVSYYDSKGKFLTQWQSYEYNAMQEKIFYYGVY